jgi:hypothetical protein
LRKCILRIIEKGDSRVLHWHGNKGFLFGLTLSLAAVGALAQQASPTPPNSVFAPPARNQCQSRYDQFYIAEPGVYAYWALCEPGSVPTAYDYAGRFDLTGSVNTWNSGSGTIQTGVSGPGVDGEPGYRVTTSSSFMAGQNMPMNSNQGTIALWVNAGAEKSAMSMIYLQPVSGHGISALTVRTITPASVTCFTAAIANSSGASFSTPATGAACAFRPAAWHRVVLTWSSGLLTLFVDGAQVSTARFTGKLDDTAFIYRLFPESINDGIPMTLAKVAIANQAWTAGQVAADFKPVIVSVPTGGVSVTTEELGTIHRDVLGFAEANVNLSSAPLVSALSTGLRAAGITSVRMANGGGGSSADQESWSGGTWCTAKRGAEVAPANVSTGDSLNSFVQRIAEPLGMSLGFTVNYGSNPPACNAGGDPVINGSDLVGYANVQQGYGVKYWEIGNEQYGGGSFETDFHPKPGLGASYGSYETQFSTQMKKRDPSILVGIPVADGVYSWLVNWTFPAMQTSQYDAVVYHNYPMTDPVTDGKTLYQERISSGLGRTRGSLLGLQTELLNFNKDPGAIWITEWNADLDGDLWSRQTLGAAMPLFATMMLGEYMRAGVQYATWWSQGPSNACMRYNYDATGENTYNWWDCGGVFLTYTGPTPSETVVGFKAGDISPVARAFQLLSQSGFVTEGEHMLRVFQDLDNAPWIVAYAATHGSSYEIILINRDRDNAHTVPLEIGGRPGATVVRQWTYGRAQYDVSRTGNWSVGPVVSTPAASGSLAATLPPWSVNVLLLN